MDTLLTSDCLLQWLEPVMLFQLGQVNRHCRAVIKEHQRTQTKYTLDYTYTTPFSLQQAIYKQCPNIQHLSVRGYYPGSFLRPSLQAVTLHLQMSLVRLKESGEWHLWNTWEFKKPLEELHSFLDKHPEAQLCELNIRLSKSVMLIFEDEHRFVVDYDRGGPIYETSDVNVETKEMDPALYFWIVEQIESLEEIRSLLKSLLQRRQWKRVGIPPEFPGAPGEEECEYNEDRMEELYKHVHQLKN